MSSFVKGRGVHSRFVKFHFDIASRADDGAAVYELYTHSKSRLAGGGHNHFKFMTNLRLTDMRHLSESWIGKSWNITIVIRRLYTAKLVKCIIGKTEILIVNIKGNIICAKIETHRWLICKAFEVRSFRAAFTVHAGFRTIVRVCTPVHHVV